MTTIKSYTDLEQSKKLAEILPLESADVLWEQHGTEPYVTIKPWNTIGKSIGCHVLPCWSLASLIEALPSIEGFKPIIDLDINQIRYEGKYRDELIVDNENLIDACYEMILKLHELNLL